MKFGRTFEASKYPPFALGYMEYSYVKSVLKSIAASAAPSAGAPLPTGSVSAPSHRTLAVKSSSDYSTQLMRLSSLLDVEKDKVDKFVAAKIEELRATLSTLSRKIAVATSNVIEARNASDDASTMLVQLDKFIRLNGVAFEKIYKKCDKVLGLQTRAWMNARLANAQFLQQLPTLEGMLVTLSDIYSRLRDLEAGPGIAASGGIWVPPESFERSTTKYWIKLEDVMSLKVSVLKHLPILLFGRDSSTYKPITPLDRDKIGESTDSGCITSIYIDSDDLSCYHSRIQREESAQLFRLRWYGSQPIPSAKSEVFVERKTHHEAWIMETSVKERFSIKAAKVLEYMSGQYDVMAAIDRRVQDGELTAEAAAPLKSLAQEIQDAIVTRNLRAKIRTRYRRTAFQLPSSNAVRVSLDTELQMCNEFQYSSWSPEQWCCNQAQMATPGAVLNFPYAVLELKLQDETPPAWVRELLETGIATPVWKFSKFLTGCTALLTPLVRMYPHWFDREGNMAEPSPPEIAAQEALHVAGFLPQDQDEQQQEDSAAQSSPNRLDALVGRLWPVKRGGESPPTAATDAQAVQRHHRYVASASTAAGLKHVIHELPNQKGSLRDLNSMVNNNDERNQYGTESGTLHNKATIAVQFVNDANHPSPPRQANEAHAMNAPLLGDTSSVTSSTASTGNTRNRRRGGRWRDWCCWPCDAAAELCQPAKPPEKGRLVPVRIEPKTHFANERTFLHWLSASLILMSLSIGLLQFGGHESNVAAYIISPVALMFIAYATFVFYWRARKIERRDPYGYHDPRGPALLGGVLFCALIVNLVVSGMYSSGKLPRKAAAVTSKGIHTSGTSSGSVISDYACGSMVAAAPGASESSIPALPQFFQPTHLANINGSHLVADQLDINLLEGASGGVPLWSAPPHTTLAGLTCGDGVQPMCYIALASTRDKGASLQVHEWTGTALQSTPSKVFSLDFPIASVTLLPPSAFRNASLLVAMGSPQPTSLVGLKLVSADCDMMGADCDFSTAFQASLLYDLLPTDSQALIDSNTYIKGVSSDASQLYVLTSDNRIVVLDVATMRTSRLIRLPDVPGCHLPEGDDAVCSWSAFSSSGERQILAAQHPPQVWTVHAGDGTRGRRTHSNLRTPADA